MSLRRASIPWLALVVLSLATTLIDPIKHLLAVQLDYVINFGQYQAADLTVRGLTISTKFLWQAYTLMLIATLVSMPFFRNNRQVLSNTFRKFMKRAPRPVLAAAIFFAMEYFVSTKKRGHCQYYAGALALMLRPVFRWSGRCRSLGLARSLLRTWAR